MDVIVVGGGVVGASAAFHLTKKGVSTALVDASHLGQATAAGTGVVFPWPFPWDAPPVWDFKARAAEHYPGLMAELAEDGQTTGYEVVGGMSVDREGGDAGFELLRTLSERPEFATMGRVERLAEGEPRRHFPLLPEPYAGVHIGGMARIDGRRVRSALFTAAGERGLHYYKGDSSLLWNGHRVTGVRVGNEDLEAPIVIVAAGAWSAGLLSVAGVELGVHPVRGQMTHFALPERDTRSWPVVRFGECDYYVSAFAPNRVVTGGTTEPEAGFDRRVTAAGLSHNLSTALELLPELAEASVVETRVGFRPGTHDGQQLLGPIERLPGVLVATGLGSQGLTFGPYQGVVAARLAMGEDPGVDLSAFVPDRSQTPSVD
ncbi:MULTISPECIES: FAD-binding oxidoreductase [unclassified Nocardiopsis]|uniref:NAD(P)/FAD-dependent oxidoreductase n=1 Tax=unclassified Nocardiopsis TaxID=2649073 RepID=UPI00066CCB19|nr:MULTISPECIES: FAD-binding oxidoreductase [unclassified Nocardiopsis]MBQ1079848.1 FAD-binding oxidoreductase [Nocardiopsis sp. B62]